MFNKFLRFSLAATAALGITLTWSAGLAGNAMSIVPNPEIALPQGDQIPQRRIETIERRVEELNATAAPETEPVWPLSPRDGASTSH